MYLADYFIKEIKKYHRAFMQKKVLRTMEEVEANTDEENIPSATALAELSNDLKIYPDYRNAVSPFSHNVTSNTDYTAESDGILFLCCVSVSTGGILSANINGVTVANHRDGSASNNLQIPTVFNIPMRRGDVIHIVASSNTYAATNTRFVPYRR